MQFSMKQNVNRARVLLLFIASIPLTLGAQVTFPIPDAIKSFEHYSHFDHCHRLMTRMLSETYQGKDSTWFRDMLMREKSYPDTATAEIRIAVKECLRKFALSDIYKDDSLVKGGSILGKARKLYFISGDTTATLALVGPYLDSVTTLASAEQQFDKHISGAEGFISRVHDKKMYELLQGKYTIPFLKERIDSFSSFKKYLFVMKHRADVEYDYFDREQALTQYNALLDMINERISQQDTTDSLELLYPMRGGILDLIREDAMYDSMRLYGYDGYLAELKKNRNNMNLSDSLWLKESALPDLKGFIAYRTDGSIWQPVTDTIANVNFSFLDSGVPHLLLFETSMCRAEYRRNSGGLRPPSQGVECWDTYEFIRWFHRMYPGVGITMVTSTVGHLSELALDPHEEARLIRESWHGYHNLPVNILVYFTPSFTISDGRRVDYPEEWEMNRRAYVRTFLQTSFKASDYWSNMPAILIDDKARVIRSIRFTHGAIPRTKKFMDAYYEWYMNNVKPQK